RSTPTASSSGSRARSCASPPPSMSSERRLGRLADVLVGYSTRVGPGDLVMIEGSELASPLVLEVAERVLRAGGHPFARIGIEGLEEIRYRESSETQLDW